MLFQSVGIIQAAIYIALFILTLMIYFIVSFMDPGYLSKDRLGIDESEEDEEPMDWEGRKALAVAAAKRRVIAAYQSSASRMMSSPTRDIVEIGPAIDGGITPHLQMPNNPKVKLKLRFCRECLVEQPLRCRHCSDCGRCIRKFDHHCPWIANCVGERNHSLFLVFLTLQSILVIWTAHLVWLSFNSDSLMMWSEWFRINWSFLCISILLVFIGLPLFCLWAYHLYLALTNNTTWESASRERITYLRELDMDVNPFHLGYARNCAVFCCAHFPYSWDAVYSRLQNVTMMEIGENVSHYAPCFQVSDQEASQVCQNGTEEERDTEEDLATHGDNEPIQTAFKPTRGTGVLPSNKISSNPKLGLVGPAALQDDEEEDCATFEGFRSASTVKTNPFPVDQSTKSGKPLGENLRVSELLPIPPPAATSSRRKKLLRAKENDTSHSANNSNSDNNMAVVEDIFNSSATVAASSSTSSLATDLSRSHA